MSTITVGILGLGRLGASVALALKRYNAGKGARHDFQVTAFDSRDAVHAAATRSGIAASMARNPVDVAKNRDILVLDLPYADVQGAYREISAFLRPGAVVLDMSPLKLPSLEWADKYLTAERGGQEQAYMVGVTPVVNPAYLFDGLDDLDHAKADLFDGGAMLLMSSPKCAKEAVELAADFSTILGSMAYFMDAGEHDALIAATEGLPALLGLATFATLRQSNSWSDSQRILNPNMGRLTHHLEDTHPDDLRDLLMNNRQGVLFALDALMRTLQQFRAVLEAGDHHAMETALIDSATSYQQWLARRRKGRWEESDEPARPNTSILGNMMGDYLSKRLRGKDDGR